MPSKQFLLLGHTLAVACCSLSHSISAFQCVAAIPWESALGLLQRFDGCSSPANGLEDRHSALPPEVRKYSRGHEGGQGARVGRGWPTLWASNHKPGLPHPSRFSKDGRGQLSHYSTGGVSTIFLCPQVSNDITAQGICITSPSAVTSGERCWELRGDVICSSKSWSR